MRLDEIDRVLGKKKKIVDRLFSEYTATKSMAVRDKLIIAIAQIYPTGETGIDQSINEYSLLLGDEVADKLKDIG